MECSMQKYQIIPRKFRPKSFSQVAGHEAIVATLKNALLQKRTGQAYLFCGARGCGKTTLARLFAKALNCDNVSDLGEPCNSCLSCQEISEGRSLDIIEIDGASNRGIDDIRQINETVGYAPSKGLYKIYIIDEVHMLTKEAFNALLKTLEEPPKHVKFFFATTEPHKVPQTILSRCQCFSLSRIPQKALLEKLHRIAKELEIDIEEKALVQVSHLSEGSLRDAESLLDQLICYGKTPITLELTREIFGLVPQELLFSLDEAIHTQDFEKATELATQFFESGKDLNATLEALLEHFRLHLLIQLGQIEEKSYQKWAKSYTKELCLYILDTLLQWQQNRLQTPFKKVYLEMLFLTLVRSRHRIPIDVLVQRLVDLEEKLEKTPEPEKKEEKVVQAKPKETIQETPSKEEDKYRNNLKNQEIPQNFCQERKTIAERQDTSEDKNSEEKPIPSKTDSSVCLSIKESPSKEEDVHPSQYDTLIRFAAVELEGSVE